MRRIIGIRATILFATNVSAQIEEPRNILEIGVAGGLNLNSMEFQPTMRQKMYNGINGGISVRYTSEKYFSMICAAQIELNFSQKGWEGVRKGKSGQPSIM